MSNYLKTNKFILNELEDTFNGLLLSDGYIGSRNGATGNYTQKCKYSLWVCEIQEMFRKFKVESTVVYNIISNPSNFGDKKKNMTTSVYNQLESKYYIEFKELRKKWYIMDYNIDEYSINQWHIDKENEEYFAWHKTIPKDIKLTPECVLNWYLGDGSSPSPNIRLATHSFYKSEVEFLVELLEEQVVDYAHMYRGRSNQYYIQIGSKMCVNEFFNYIDHLHYPSCYAYKFPKEFIRGDISV